MRRSPAKCRASPQRHCLTKGKRMCRSYPSLRALQTAHVAPRNVNALLAVAPRLRELHERGEVVRENRQTPPILPSSLANTITRFFSDMRGLSEARACRLLKCAPVLRGRDSDMQMTAAPSRYFRRMHLRLLCKLYDSRVWKTVCPTGSFA